MDHSRIADVIDVEALSTKRITVFGTGAAVGLICDIARSGMQHFLLIDPDRVGIENPSRQGHEPKQIGQYKVDAVKAKILEINPDAQVETLTVDLTTMSEEEAMTYVIDTDLFLATTDAFPAQALVNRLALRLGVPAVFVGIYAGGLGAEVVYIDPQYLLACFRCLCSGRYAAQQQAISNGKPSLDPTSQGVDIFCVRIPDAIAGQIAIGLLTRGADNRYGRLINELRDLQFMQISMSPEFKLNGRDIVREKLGVPEFQSSYFTWNTIAIADPDNGQLFCQDCEELRGHRFEEVDGKSVRFTDQSGQLSEFTA